MTGLGSIWKRCTRVHAHAFPVPLEMGFNTRPKSKYPQVLTGDTAQWRSQAEHDLMLTFIFHFLNWTQNWATHLGSRQIPSFIYTTFQFPILRTNRSLLLSWRGDGTNKNSETTSPRNAFGRLTRVKCVRACTSLHNSHIIFSAVNQPV